MSNKTMYKLYLPPLKYVAALPRQSYMFIFVAFYTVFQ